MVQSDTILIWRASKSDLDEGIEIIEEYSDAINVTVRDDREAIRKYLQADSGL